MHQLAGEGQGSRSCGHLLLAPGTPRKGAGPQHPSTLATLEGATEHLLGYQIIMTQDHSRYRYLALPYWSRMVGLTQGGPLIVTSCAKSLYPLRYLERVAAVLRPAAASAQRRCAAQSIPAH